MLTEDEIHKHEEINLDMAGFNIEGKSSQDRRRKHKKLRNVDQLKQEIIRTRMAVQDHGLSVIEAKIQALQDERTAILFGPATKEDLLTKTKEVVHDRKQEALTRLLFMPLSVTKDNNFYPFMNTTSGKFKEEHLWDLFFLAITDEDLEAVIDQMPDTGLSQAERQAKITKINNEIEKLERSLNDELEDAKNELKERHKIEASDRLEIKEIEKK